MRVRTAGVAVLVAAAGAMVLGPAIATGGGDFSEYKPSGSGDRPCKTRALRTKPRVIKFRVSCDFLVSSITLSTSERPRRFKRQLRLDRKVDPGDRMRCVRQKRSVGLTCRGEIGRRARATGWFRTRARACTVTTGFDLLGGEDCDPPFAKNEVCIDIGYAAGRSPRYPAGCG